VVDSSELKWETHVPTSPNDANHHYVEIISPLSTFHTFATSSPHAPFVTQSYPSTCFQSNAQKCRSHFPNSQNTPLFSYIYLPCPTQASPPQLIPQFLAAIVSSSSPISFPSFSISFAYPFGDFDLMALAPSKVSPFSGFSLSDGAGAAVRNPTCSVSLSFLNHKVGSRNLAVCASPAPLTGVIFEPFEEVKKEELAVPTAPQVSLARQYYTDECESAINEQIKWALLWFSIFFGLILE